MGDVKEGQTHLGLDVFELQLHLSTKLEIQCSKGLIQKEKCGTVHDSTSQRDALLLATGELRGLSGGDVGKLHQSQGVSRQLFGVSNLAAFQTEHDVLEDCHVREQGVGLEDRVDRTLIRLGGGDVFPADQDLTLGGLLQPCYEPKRRGFPTTAWPEQGEEGTSRNL